MKWLVGMQKIIVSDTSCIGYLIQINRLNILEIIYGEIIIPLAVYDEILQLENKGFILSEFKKATWIKTYPANNLSNVEYYKYLLDKGELLARLMGIKAIGLLGVLLLSKEKKVISHIQAILEELITNTTFRIDKNLYKSILKQANEL